MTIAPESTVARSPDVLHRVLEGEAVLVDLDTGTYYGLDEVGTRIWELLDAESGVRVDAVAAAIVEEYEVAREVATRDLVALLERLESRRLVRVLGPTA